MGLKKGEVVAKVIEGGGERTVSLTRIKRVLGGVVFIGNGESPDAVDAYDERTGNAKVNYIRGFRSYIVPLDGGVLEKIKQKAVR